MTSGAPTGGIDRPATGVEDAPVLFEIVERHVALVTLNRPRKRNAITGEMAALIHQAVGRIEADPAIRAAVLTSCLPDVFCAGADMGEIAAGRSLSAGEAGFAGFVYAERTKPWIAAVDGAAFAGGCELVLACDMIVASEGAAFGLPEVQRGLIAGAGGLHRMAQLLPRNIALELIAAGTALSAPRAFALGMVNRLARPGEAQAEALALAGRIADNAPLAVARSLAIALNARGAREDDLRSLSAEAFAAVRASEDAKEGVRAFLEKRSPLGLGR